MKNVVFLLLVTTFCFGQKGKPNLPIDSITNKITYKETIVADSIKSDQLYLNAKKWIALAFKSAQDVIQYDQNNSIIAKGNIGVYSKKQPAGIIKFTLKIDVKDYKYRYELSEFVHSKDIDFPYSLGPCEEMINTKDRTMGISNQKGYNLILTSMDENIKNMIIDLKANMNTKPSDW